MVNINPVKLVRLHNYQLVVWSERDMGVSLIVFVEVGYEAKRLGQANDQSISWSTVIQVQWFRSHSELYRLMGRPSSDDGWVMYSLRGMPSDASEDAKEYAKAVGSDQISWITAQELFELQEALAYPEHMPEFHATVAFVREYQKHDPDHPMRIVYCFSP
jgi:hypothetical protein